MDDRLFAKHLRKPEGKIGIAVGKVMNQINLFLNTFTYETMHIQDKEQILEIGFGNGRFIHDIIKRAENVFYKGIEISDIMLQEALNKNKKLIDQGVVELKLESSNNISFENEQFDKICTINTIYFWKNPEIDLKEIYRVLKKNGSLFISIRSKNKMELGNFEQFGFTTYEYEDVKLLLKKAGFSNIEKRYKLEPKHELTRDVLCIIATK